MVIIGFECFAQVESDYDRYVKEQKEQMEEIKHDDDARIQKLNRQYEKYVKAEKEAYDRFVKKMTAKWSEGNRDRYFKDVTDKRKQKLCVIASYFMTMTNLLP